MGVNGLWQEIKPTGKAESLERLAAAVFDDALKQGETIDRSRLLGLRVGIDASAWFFHAEKTDGGANPVLRTLFHRTVRLSRNGILALFVFDGPHRPSYKRGQHIYRGAHAGHAQFKRIIEAMGFEWRLAPGEAEAELAVLNAEGIIDLVITDDVDCLVFGARKLFKNVTNAADHGHSPPTLYSSEAVQRATGLDNSGMVLVALMAGGDYDTTGIAKIGPTYATALARAGYGKELAEAAASLEGSELRAWLATFRDRIRHQLASNEDGLLSRKAKKAASDIPDSWPDAKVVKEYFFPVTSRLPQYKHFDKGPPRWQGHIDIGELVRVFDEVFEDTHKGIERTLRNRIWIPIAVNHLIRALHQNSSWADAHDFTKTMTPSKQLASAVADLQMPSPSKASSSDGTERSHTAARCLLPRHIRSLFDEVGKDRGPHKDKVTEEVKLWLTPDALADEAARHFRHPDPNVGKLQERKALEYSLKIARGEDAVLSGDKNYKEFHPHDRLDCWIQKSLVQMAYRGLLQERDAALAAKAARSSKGKKKKLGPERAVTRKVSISDYAVEGTRKTQSGGQVEQAAFVKASIKGGPTRDDASSSENGDDDLEGVDDDDVFTEPRKALPRSSGAARARPEVLDDRPSGSRPSANIRRQRSASPTSLSSDSDIVPIRSSKLQSTTKDASPKKSPRKARTQATVRRGAVSGRSENQAEHNLLSSFLAVSKGNLASSKISTTATTKGANRGDSSESEDSLPDIRGMLHGRTKSGVSDPGQASPDTFPDDPDESVVIVPAPRLRGSNDSRVRSSAATATVPSQRNPMFFGTNPSKSSSSNLTKQSAARGPSGALDVIDLCSSD